MSPVKTDKAKLLAKFTLIKPNHQLTLTDFICNIQL